MISKIMNIALFLSSALGFANGMNIVTIDSPLREILYQKTENIQECELPLAKEIADQLFLALKPHFPAAGLAAPQIGINKSLFIFSFDRDPKNLEVVINPSFVPVGSVLLEGWEACFSVLLSKETWKIAHIPRYETIRVTFLNLDGKKTEKTLEGFAAKVFQHEYDHLQGIECIDRKDATVKSFESKEALLNFMKDVKKEDSMRYIKPTENLHPRVGIGVLVEHKGKILLGQRKGAHGASTWAPPGGHLEFGEDVKECAKRELLEETGLKATSCTLGPWVENVMENGKKHYITLFVIVDRFEGELQLLEPNKCEGWQWFSWKELPEPLFASLASFVDLHRLGD